MTAPAIEERTAPMLIVNAENPWPGLLPFTEEIRDYFFGRESDAEELLQSIRRTTLTILYGKSGLGKTSLLRAGLFPRLRGADFLPIYVRLDHTGRGPTPVQQVKEAIRQAFASEKIDALMPESDQTLWEYFHGQRTGFWKEGFIPVVPVLVFDQFEELFTIGRAGHASKAAAAEFVEEFAGLVENVPPPSVKDRLDSNPNEAVAFSHEAHNYKIVLSLREDYLAELEDLARFMPSLRYNRMSLRPFTGMQAAEVVVKPGADLVEEGLAPRIIRFVAESAHKEGDAAHHPEKDLAEIEVEPALLSLFCRELNNKRMASGRLKITADLLDGTSREILSDFYESSMLNIPIEVREFIEDQLVTVDGFRDSEDLGNALRQPGFSPEIVDELVRRRLIRIEEHHGSKRIELTHDVLTGLARSSRELSEARQAEERAKQERLQAEAREQARLKQLRQAHLRVIWSTSFGVLFFAVACLAGGFGWKAHQAQDSAENEKVAADDARRLAEQDKKKAEVARRDAESERQKANKARHDEERAHQEAENAQKKSEEFLSYLILEIGPKLKLTKPKQTNRQLLDEIENTLDQQYGTAVGEKETDEILRIKNFFNNDRGDLAFNGGERDKALNFYNQFRQTAEELAARRPDDGDVQRDLSLAYRNIGQVLHAQDKWDQALDAYNSNIDILKRLVDRNLDDATSLRLLLVSYKTNWDMQRERRDENAARESLDKAFKVLDNLKSPAAQSQLTAEQLASIRAIEKELKTPTITPRPSRQR